MTKVVQDFLWAQKVQEPVALFSDWLYVGHVDEFMTFVPAPGPKVNNLHNQYVKAILTLLPYGFKLVGQRRLEMLKHFLNEIDNLSLIYHLLHTWWFYLSVCLSCVQGFRLLLASPDAGYKLFKGLQNDGHGKAKIFDGNQQIMGCLYACSQ